MRWIQRSFLIGILFYDSRVNGKLQYVRVRRATVGSERAPRGRVVAHKISDRPAWLQTGRNCGPIDEVRAHIDTHPKLRVDSRRR